VHFFGRSGERTPPRGRHRFILQGGLPLSRPKLEPRVKWAGLHGLARGEGDILSTGRGENRIMPGFQGCFSSPLCRCCCCCSALGARTPTCSPRHGRCSRSTRSLQGWWMRGGTIASPLSLFMDLFRGLDFLGEEGQRNLVAWPCAPSRQEEKEGTHPRERAAQVRCRMGGIRLKGPRSAETGSC
jgi:hypothetical protein